MHFDHLNFLVFDVVPTRVALHELQHGAHTSMHKTENVWTTDRLTKAHEFIADKVKKEAQWDLSKNDFSTLDTFKAKAAPYSLAPKQPTKYGYNVRICGPDFYVDEVGKEQKNLIDTDYIFELNSRGNYARSKVSRFNQWKKAVEHAIDNVCQFVC